MKHKIISSLVFSLGIITFMGPFGFVKNFLVDKNINNVSIGMAIAMFLFAAVFLSIIPSLGYGIGLLTFKTKPRRQMHSFIMGFVFGVVALALASLLVEEEPSTDEIWSQRIVFFVGGFCSAGIINVFNQFVGEEHQSKFMQRTAKTKGMTASAIDITKPVFLKIRPSRRTFYKWLRFAVLISIIVIVVVFFAIRSEPITGTMVGLGAGFGLAVFFIVSYRGYLVINEERVLFKNPRIINELMEGGRIPLGKIGYYRPVYFPKAELLKDAIGIEFFVRIPGDKVKSVIYCHEGAIPYEIWMELDRILQGQGIKKIKSREEIVEEIKVSEDNSSIEFLAETYKVVPMLSTDINDN